MNIHDITKKIRALADELDSVKDAEQPASFNLPTPPPGMKWHREDGWTVEMLPPGMRPLCFDEHSTNQTQQLYIGRWVNLVNAIMADAVEDHLRTTRPLTFTHGGHEWTWHRAGDPMPCDGERMVEFLLGNGLVGGKGKACGLHWKVEKGKQLADHHLIIGWRYADFVDPYAELKAAHAAGKVIQVKGIENWIDCQHLSWKYPPDTYRIKPDDGPPCSHADNDVDLIIKGVLKARKLERERDELREALSGRTVSCSRCNEAGYKLAGFEAEVAGLRAENEDLREAIQEAYDAIKASPYPDQQALDKLKPFITAP